MSIMLAGLKAVRQRRRMRSITSSRRNRKNDNDDDDDIGFDTSRFLVNHHDGDDEYDDGDDDDQCPEDESPMLSTKNRKKWMMDNDGATSSSCKQTDSNNKHCVTGRNENDNKSSTAKTAISSDNNTTNNTTGCSSNKLNVQAIIDDEDDDEEDEIITAGNEALLFIYGHNVNLYTDVFQLPSANQQDNRDNHHEIHSLLLLEQINRSYNEQMHYLHLTNVTLAMEYFRRRHNKKSKYVQAMNTMEPKTFLDIQKDALHRAYTILMHDESRKEYDELLRLHHQDMSDGNDEARDLVAYGDDEEDEVEATSDSFASMESRTSDEEEEEEEEEGEDSEAEEDYSDNESDILSVQTTEEDEDYYEEEVDEDEGRILSMTSPRNMTTPEQHHSRHYQQQQYQYSPTDPMEFDMLLQNSLEDDEYYSQLYRNIKTREEVLNTKNSADNDDIFTFDPFNLQGDDMMSNEQETNRVLFPEKAIESEEYYEDEEEEEDYDDVNNENHAMSSYVCPLPSSEEDDVENEITMGRLIELQEKMSKMKKSSLYLDDILKSSSREETDSDGEYEDCEEAKDSEDQGTANEGDDENVTTRTIDDGSILTKTKNYFVDDNSTVASLPKPTNRNSAASLAMSIVSTSSWASSRSGSAPKKENKKTSKRKSLKAKVRNLVKTIGSKSKSSTPSSLVVDDDDKFPEQEVYGSSSNNSICSRRSRAAASPAVHPNVIESSPLDNHGLNLSSTSCDMTTTSSALVSDEDEEVAEIENFLSIASTFSAMDAAAVIAERVRNRKSSMPSDIYDAEDDKIDCFSTDDDNTSHRSCQRRRRRQLSRFESDNEMILEEDDDYDDDDYSQSADGHGWSSSPPSSASRGIFGSCIDGVGSSISNTLDSVERVLFCQEAGNDV